MVGLVNFVLLCKHYNAHINIVNIIAILRLIFTKKTLSTIERSMKTVTVGVRMPKEMRKELQELADDDMRTLSNLILKILTEYLKEHKENPKK
jgi:CopG-like RHH_1 or ribbon-helix-helix domain, RHH_5